MIRRAEAVLLVAQAVILPLAFLPDGLSPFTVAKTDGFGILTIALLAARAAGGPAAWRATVGSLARSPVVWPAAAVALAAAAGRPSPGRTELQWGAVLTLLVASHPGPGIARKVAAAFAATMVAVAGYALAQFAGLDPFGWERSFAGGAPSATFGNPLFLGTALAAAICVVAAREMSAPRLAVVAILAGALAVSQARGAWLGAGVAVGIVVAAPAWRGRRRRGFPRGLLAVGLAVVALAATGRLPGLAVHAAGAFDGSHWRGRLMLWEAGGRMVRMSPVAGRGPGATRREFLGVQARLLAEPRYAALPYRSTAHVHQDLIQFAGERGIVGAGAMVWLIVAAAAAGLARGASASRRAAAAVVLGWCADGLVNGPLHVAPSSHLVWIWVGLAGGVASSRRSGSPASMSGHAGLFVAVVAILCARPFARDCAGEMYLGVGARLADAHVVAAAQEALLAADALVREDRRQHFHAGRGWYAAEQWADAVREFSLDTVANPGAASGWHNLGLALRMAGQRVAAQAAFGRAAALNPRDPESARLAAKKQAGQ